LREENGTASKQPLGVSLETEVETRLLCHFGRAEVEWKSKHFRPFMDQAVFASGVFKDDSTVVAFDRSYFVDLRVSAVLTTAVYELVAVLRAILFRPPRSC
jgi:hypothetical protein